MANSSSKKIAAANASFLSLTQRAMALVNVLTIALLFLWRGFPAIGWIWWPYYASMVASLALYRTLATMGAVTKGATGQVSVAADLGGPGLHQYVFDAFALVLVAQAVAVVTPKGWYLLLIIPAYALYRIAKLAKRFLF